MKTLKWCVKKNAKRDTGVGVLCRYILSKQMLDQYDRVEDIWEYIEELMDTDPEFPSTIADFNQLKSAYARTYKH